ncbi:MAG: efflux transporter outer membrane subunit [Verrucomicrobiae bacterium]|nr:efflux transporter outer membrane subunit [Verrucomicrobiae bacterium]
MNKFYTKNFNIRETMKQNTFFSHISVMVLSTVLLLLVGCKVGPEYKSPQAKVPQTWVATSLVSNQNIKPTISEKSEFARWWTNFNDPVLTKLVESALEQNLDIKIAISRIRQARESYGITRASLFPSSQASASYSRSYQNRPSQSADSFRAGIDALWELDFFGGNRRSVEAAMANINAAVEYFRDVQVALAAEVALNYINLRAVQQQISIATNNLKMQLQTLNITRQRYKAGFVSKLDVANAEAQAATTESQVSTLESSMRQTMHNIAFLLGKQPSELIEELEWKQPVSPVIPEPSQNIVLSVPSEILRRRPDIRRAEAQLHSATAKIGVATADLFPKFKITGGLTLQETSLGELFTHPVRSGSFGPSIDWQIFSAGAIKSNIRLQEALRDESFINYQKVVLNAIAEVENAIVTLAKEQEHAASLQKAVDSNREAVQIALKLYTEGQTDFLNVISAQRSLLSSEDSLAQSRRNISTAVIALYKALGGDWSVSPPETTDLSHKN